MIKTIKTTIILGDGEFSDGTNTRIIEGLATKVDVQKAGLPEKNTAHIQIANLSLAEMEQLTFLAFRAQESRKNKILVEAGEKGQRLSTVFKGDITSSFPDFSSAPDIYLNIEAMTAGWSLRINSSPTSIDGEAPANDLFAQLANEAGFNYINFGIKSSVKYTTLTGSPIEKAQQLAKEINCELIIDDESFITQEWGTPYGEAVVLGADCGLLGYPAFTSEGISGRCFFTPALRYGGQIKLVTDLPKASGYWKITSLSHSLSAYTDGEWASSFEGTWLQEGEQKNE